MKNNSKQIVFLHINNTEITTVPLKWIFSSLK